MVLSSTRETSSSMPCMPHRVWGSSAPKGSSIEDDAGAVDQRACDCDALLHPARQLLRIVIGEVEESDGFEVFLDRSRRSRFGSALQSQAVFHVVAHRRPPERRLRLEHHAAVRRRPRVTLACRPLRPSRMLAAAVRPTDFRIVDLPHPDGPGTRRSRHSPVCRQSRTRHREPPRWRVRSDRCRSRSSGSPEVVVFR